MDRYEELKTLGRGSFGVAVLVRRRTDDKLLVLKRVQTGGLDTAERDAAEREVDTLKSLRFPHVVGYADSFGEGPDGRDALCVVMEYAEEGTLEDVLNARKAEGRGAMPQREAMDAFVQILEVGVRAARRPSQSTVFASLERRRRSRSDHHFYFS